MDTSGTLYSDGTVEISDSIYRCLVGALRTIAAGNDDCCAEHVQRKGRHSSTCAVGIARSAFQEADRLDSFPNAILGRSDRE
jgi:hypothetical protein